MYAIIPIMEALASCPLVSDPQLGLAISPSATNPGICTMRGNGGAQAAEAIGLDPGGNRIRWNGAERAGRCIVESYHSCARDCPPDHGGSWFSGI